MTFNQSFEARSRSQSYKQPCIINVLWIPFSQHIIHQSSVT